MLPLNAGLAGLGGGLGKRLDPYAGYNFLIEIEGLLTGGFSEVSGLEGEVKYDEVEEGGVNNYTHKLPVRTSYQNLTLKHGLTGLDTLWNWYSAVTRGVIQRKNATIYLLDHQYVPVLWWNVRRTLPVKWTGPEFRADQSEVIFESIELAHEGLSRPLGSQLLALGRSGAQLGGFKGF